MDTKTLKSQKLTHENTLITICKYDSYQQKKNGANHRLTTEKPQTNHRLTTDQPLLKNIKNIKNIKNSYCCYYENGEEEKQRTTRFLENLQNTTNISNDPNQPKYKFDTDTLNSFFNYWTQKVDETGKMKFEDFNDFFDMDFQIQRWSQKRESLKKANPNF